MFIELDDVTLHVRDSGAGEPAVLLHGWPDTGDLWRHQIPALAAHGYRVIVPDLRGFGGSSRPAEIDAYAAPHMVADVIGLLDRLGLDRAHLVGHDWGAAIGWLTAALAPHRVATLTALSSATRRPSTPPAGPSGKSPGTCCCSSFPASPNNG